MIAMAADGSQERFLTRKFLPFTAIFVLTASIVMIGFGVGMIVHEKTQTAPIILVVAGSIGIPLGCVGLYWWIKKRTFDEMEKPLIWFIGLLIVVSVPTLVAGCLGILDVNKKALLKDDFEADLKLYGKTGHYEILRNIDRRQIEGKCCGAINYADWRHTAYGGGRYDKVPDSCCKVDHRRHACGFEFELSKINQKGCNSYSPALDGMKLHLKLVAYGGIICGIIEIILWIALLFLCLCGRSPSNGQHRQTYKKTESFSVHTLEEKEPRGVGAQDNQASAGEERPPDTQEKAF
ncbi:CD63 antigen-like [Montipora foliosa]|uniref:CD63 antigen-like n=1 Tax=Montipora foliosa TaxID=591990 RepID=UPI0035F1BCBD